MGATSLELATTFRAIYHVFKMKNLALMLVCLSALGVFATAQTPSTDTPAAKPKTATAVTHKKTPATTTAKKPGTTAAKAATGSKVTLDTQQKKASYAMGMNLGRNLHTQKIDVNSDALIQGLRDGMSGAKPAMTEEEAREVLTQFQNQMRTKMQAEASQAAAKNKAEGEKFLAENKTKPGVTTLPSGLQYKIITAGTGPKPSATDTVVCNYKGSLLNGKEFDSSYKRGEPTTFPVNGVIKGWTEALQMMPVGSKWQLFIPADLAYGDRGAGQDIEPGSTLIFEVELVSIKDKNAK